MARLLGFRAGRGGRPRVPSGGRGGRRSRPPRRAHVSRIAAPVLLLCLAGALAAYLVFGAGAGEKTADYGTWHGAFSYEPGPLDPARAVTVTDGSACALVYNGLLKPDEEGRPAPDLAYDWEVSADGLVWTFHLRSGVKFHDGSDFDAADVVFSPAGYKRGPGVHDRAGVVGGRPGGVRPADGEDNAGRAAGTLLIARPRPTWSAPRR